KRTRNQNIYSIETLPRTGDDMRAFRVEGTYKINPKRRQKFSIEIAANDENDAIHRILSNLGSRHKVPRKQIQLNEIKEINNEEITNPVVRYLVGGAR
ncbi:MAG: 50S ribosomal protein L18Ae, partial [Methanomassiliicoccales archaeon]|nr:50S ribosomal protein L18Ae [Methanomassiliicoccales archaeon]